MKLFQAYCLSFYGSSLWRLDCPELNSLSVAFNIVIRRIWNLPQRSHTSVVHCLGSTGSIHNIIFSKFCTMFNACISHASPLIHSIFTVSAQSCNSNFIGYSEQPFLCPACCQAHNLQQIAKLDSLWERVQIRTSWKLRRTMF